MYFISVTRLRVRSILFLPAFFKANSGTIKMIKTMHGYLDGLELVDKGFTFWTVTIWESVQDMKYFRSHDPHQTAMRKLPHWCNEGAYVHWEQEENKMPDWDTVYKKMISEGRLTKVKHPSPRQLNMSYPPPAWTKIGRPIKPVVK